MAGNFKSKKKLFKFFQFLFLLDTFFLFVFRLCFKSALDELSQLLSEEGVVSAYELHSSGLVQALLSLLSTGPWDEGQKSNKTSKLQKQRVRVFKNCFKEKDGENGSINAGMILVHKLISVLESIEKLPVYLYDTPGSGYGLQVIERDRFDNEFFFLFTHLFAYLQLF